MRRVGGCHSLQSGQVREYGLAWGRSRIGTEAFWPATPHPVAPNHACLRQRARAAAPYHSGSGARWSSVRASDTTDVDGESLYRLSIACAAAARPLEHPNRPQQQCCYSSIFAVCWWTHVIAGVVLDLLTAWGIRPHPSANDM